MQKILSVLYLVTAVLFFAVGQNANIDISLFAIKNIVLKTLFPMMVLSKVITLGPLEKLLKKSAVWQKLSISDTLIKTVIFGIIAGFPASSSEIERLKKEGLINDDEAKKAVALSSAPSLAFMLKVAGRNVTEGGILFIVSLVISYLVALSHKSTKSSYEAFKKPYTLPKAIALSGVSVINVSANIIFFNFLNSLFSFLPPFVTLFLASLFELASGSVLVKDSPLFFCFLVGFGSLSALFQIKSEADSVSLSLYIKARLITAFVFILLKTSALLTIFLVIVFLLIKKALKKRRDRFIIIQKELRM